ncbi:uncharacterized protein LOC112043745 isoform X5 [Bicyclus anynana]|uniref:Uncharacterized protein LOC112043745 isoform X5 n=1 Tax=Bicyclus anynana TaxID=110368 RepID=A0A6J1MQA9_BICAN|nr:uncharacterized protein LOC112043745 isoform X5 [Bicyclus anynana]
MGMDLISSIMIGLFIFMCLYLFWLWFCFGSCVTRRQKTRNSQQRRTFVAPRQRPSVSQTEPTIYVSPANLPPPPKYEAMAPPSYEEVVGIHYPNYQPVQPITQPITTALAQSSNSADNVTVTDTENNVTNTVTQNNASCSVPSNVAPAVVTIANERTVPTASS